MKSSRISVVLASLGVVLMVASASAAPVAAFRDVGPMLTPRQMHGAAYHVAKQTLYVVGGNTSIFGDPAVDPVGSVGDTVSCQYFTFDLSGPLPAITASGWGPPMTQFHVNCGSSEDNVAAYIPDGVLVIGDRLYCAPGNSNASAPWGINRLLFTNIGASGQLADASWTVAGTPEVTTAGNIIFDAGWAYHAGSKRIYRASGREVAEGCTGGSAVYVTRCDSWEIDTDGTLKAGTWRSEPVLPAARRWGQFEIVGDLAIYVGGTSSTGTYQSTVYVATVNPTTGVLGAWATSVNPFPSTAVMVAGCADGGYIYCLTGRATTTTEITTARRALAGATDIGTWETVASLPYSNRYAAGAGGGGQFFITGARNYNATTSVMTDDIFALDYAPAVVGNDALLGAWNTTNAYTMVRGTDSVALPKNHNVWTAAFGPTAGTKYDFKVLKDQNASWGAANEIGGAAGGGNASFVAGAGTDSIVFVEKNALPATWTPQTYTLGLNTGFTWVAVGEFQSEAGEAGDWAPTSTVTVLNDAGTGGDTAAADGVYTFQAVLTGALSPALYKVTRQGAWAGATKFGTNGWSGDPDDSNNGSITAGVGDTLKIEFIPTRGQLRHTITPASSVGDWMMY